MNVCLIGAQCTLLLCEHPPVYTSGRRVAANPAESARLTALGAAHHAVLISASTYQLAPCALHPIVMCADEPGRRDDVPWPRAAGWLSNPGPRALQGVCIHHTGIHDDCMILPRSDRTQPSLKWYVCRLEQVLIDTIAQFGVTGVRTPNTGVWVGDNKIAALGAAAADLHAIHTSRRGGVAICGDARVCAELQRGSGLVPAHRPVRHSRQGRHVARAGARPRRSAPPRRSTRLHPQCPSTRSLRCWSSSFAACSTSSSRAGSRRFLIADASKISTIFPPE